MPVQVRFFAAARSAAGTSQTEVEPGTLASLLAELTERTPDLTEVLPRCSLLINGVAVHGDPSEVVVEAGSELDVLPPFAGG
jgi:molybdopterin synthase sulfur carrier subunit